MIADEADLGAIRWNSADFIIVGAKATAIGKGKKKHKKNCSGNGYRG
jgi:hypothetical protein